jgi:hypothetical protein
MSAGNRGLSEKRVEGKAPSTNAIIFTIFAKNFKKSMTFISKCDIVITVFGRIFWTYGPWPLPGGQPFGVLYKEDPGGSASDKIKLPPGLHYAR